MDVRPLAIAISLLSSSLLANDFVVNLKDPEYKNGVVKTEKGGVICAPDLRVQACKIVYFDTSIDGCHIHKVIAEGDLMLVFCGRVFVGDKLEFNLADRTGYLINGRAKEGNWFIGGELVELRGDGSFEVTNAYITTSVSVSNYWALTASRAEVYDGTSLYARNIKFEVGHIPLFWLPGYKSDLCRFKDPPLRYRLLWDKGLGPRVSARYRFFSNDTTTMTARFDYRLTKWVDHGFKLRGPGAALEGTYDSPSGLTTFQTRNYAAYDKNYPNENGEKRFRFQGLLHSESEDKRTQFHVQWDRMSDSRMVGDFKESEFEVNTNKATYAELSHYRPQTFAGVVYRPRINYFQSLAQELPNGATGIRPFHFLGIISENFARGGYLDYTYSNQIDNLLQDRVSGRLETVNTLYRPLSLGGLTLTPKAGLRGIFYSKSPEKQAIGQLVYTYGGDANLRFYKQFSSVRHSVEPYATYLGYSRPRIPVDDYFVFDIHDGYDRLDQLRFGLRQLFFNSAHSIFQPTFVFDLYSYAFWGAESFTQRIPKIFADIELNRQTWSLAAEAGWNLQENLIDYGNARLLWTVSATFALGVEFRHRSKFWWRKAIYENYVVDFARPIDELLISPLSDRRDTLLFKAHMRLSPRWNFNIQTHHGWNRDDEPPYHGVKADLYTMLTGRWQMKLSYEYQPNDPFRFSYSFKLIQ